MSGINMGRVILGGLLAGLVMNIGETILNVPILGAQMDAAMESLGLDPPGGGAIAVFVIMTFGLGILMVWLYAAVRPRLGAGPQTAVIVGLVIWVLAWVFAGVPMAVMGMFPTRVMLIVCIWGLVEAPLASVAGAWLYREE